MATTVCLDGTLVKVESTTGSENDETTKPATTTTWKWSGKWAFGVKLVPEASKEEQLKQPFEYVYEKEIPPNFVLVPSLSPLPELKPLIIEREIKDDEKKLLSQAAAKAAEVAAKVLADAKSSTGTEVTTDSLTKKEGSDTKSEEPVSVAATSVSAEKSPEASTEAKHPPASQSIENKGSEKKDEAPSRPKQSEISNSNVSGEKKKADEDATGSGASSKTPAAEATTEAGAAVIEEASSSDKNKIEGQVATPTVDKASTPLEKVASVTTPSLSKQTEKKEEATPTPKRPISSIKDKYDGPFEYPDHEPEGGFTFASKLDDDDPEFQEGNAEFPELPPSGYFLGQFDNFSGTKTSQVNERFYLCFQSNPPVSAKYMFPELPEADETTLKKGEVWVRGQGTNSFGIFELAGKWESTTGRMVIQRKYVALAPPPIRKRSPRNKGYLQGAVRTSGTRRKRQPSLKMKQQLEEVTATATAPTLTPTGPKRKRSKSVGPGDSSTPVASSNAIIPSTLSPKNDETGSGKKPLMIDTSVIPNSMAHGNLVATAPTKSTTPTASSNTPKTAKKPRRRRSSKTNTAAASTPTSAPSTSPAFSLKLPPSGDPKLARWRAAHFLYYQRQEPQEGETVPPNPKYVVYEGELFNGLREGTGLCLYNNGLLYEGSWKQNKEHGKGRLWTADRKRLIYDGDFERGRLQGHGIYRYCSVSYYQGEFKENTRNGYGKYVLPDGSVYEGQWSQGMMNGRGIFTWQDGSLYDGEWKDNKRHGQGILRAADGFYYDGSWVGNAMEGRGSATYPQGQKYDGMFSNGRREGRGTLYFTNGAVYEGRFRDDAIDGQGTMKMPRTMVVPIEDDQKDGDGETSGSAESKENEDTTEANQEESREERVLKQTKPDFMIPISFQSDMTHIHNRAGFTAIGD